MGQLSPSFRLKRCEPGIAHGADAPEIQFGNRKARPVHAEIHCGGEFTSTGIAFEDYSRMQTRRRKFAGGRRLDTPEWSLDNRKLREVIVNYLETRVYSKKRRQSIRGSLIQRLNAVEHELRYRRAARLSEIMRKLCNEFVAEKRKPNRDLARLRQLQIEIRNLDTTRRFERSAAAMVAAVVYLYYRAGQDSVSVSTELGITPMHVRQMLWRLNRVAKLASQGIVKPKSLNV